MKFTRIFAIGAFFVAALPGPAAAGSNPAVSIQALFSKEDCEEIPGLLGDWLPEAGNDLSGHWTIQKLGEKQYRLVGRDADPKGKKLAFDICVAHLDGHLFFDAIGQVVGPDGKDLFQVGDDSFWIPAHLIGRLDIENDALHFRLLDDSWLREEFDSGRVSLTNAKNDDGDYFVTAPGKELKLFMAHIADDPTAFPNDEEFSRDFQAGEISDH